MMININNKSIGVIGLVCEHCALPVRLNGLMAKHLDTLTGKMVIITELAASNRSNQLIFAFQGEPTDNGMEHCVEYHTFPTIRYSEDDFLAKYGELYVRFESVNFPNFFIRHRSYECWLDEFGANGGEDLFNADSSFKVVEGLSNWVSGANRGVSFQSQNFPDYYLTHKDGLIRIENVASDPNLKDDATWMMVDGLWPDDNGDTYSLSYPAAPSMFIRHQGYRLKMHENDQSELFFKDASFNIRIAGKNGHWNDIHCEVEFPGVCQFLPEGNPKPLIEWPRTGGCPADWYQFAGNCYAIPVKTNTASDLPRLRMYKGAQQESFPSFSCIF